MKSAIYTNERRRCTRRNGLPPIPRSLRRIDAATVDDHFWLEAGDQCYYVWDYATRHSDESGSPRQLISDLKLKPSSCGKAPALLEAKFRALAHAATALRNLLAREFVEARATFVPIPGSKSRGHPDYDDRLGMVLEQAFLEWESHVQKIVRQTRSTASDHESVCRLRLDDLREITELTDPAPAAPKSAKPRRVIVIVDDVLNSGKHFKLAGSLVHSRFPGAEVRGLFLTRCRRKRAPIPSRRNHTRLRFPLPILEEGKRPFSAGFETWNPAF